VPKVRLEAPWRQLSSAEVARLRGQLGVYELADGDGRTVLIGCAGGRCPFGLRGELERHLEEAGRTGARQFRVEVTMAYLSRWRELLMVHHHDHGSLPHLNPEDPARLGRLSPA
jgi:hypothetical protein